MDRFGNDESLRAWAVEQAGGNVDVAKRIAEFVRPSQDARERLQQQFLRELREAQDRFEAAR